MYVCMYAPPCPVGIGKLAFRTDTLFTPAPLGPVFLSIYLSGSAGGKRCWVDCRNARVGKDSNPSAKGVGGASICRLTIDLYKATVVSGEHPSGAEQGSPLKVCI